MRKWLRSFTVYGNATVTTVQLAWNWGIIVSALATAAVVAWAWWDWATTYGYLPVVIAGLVTFAAIIWIINGVAALRRRGTPTRPKMLFDYSYALALVGAHSGFDKNDEANYYQPGIVWKNAGPAAIKFHVDEFRVVIGDRTSQRPFNPDGFIARDCHLTFMFAPFSKQQLAGVPLKTGGMIEYTVRYGHPDHGYFRVAKIRLNCTFNLENGGLLYLIGTQSDQELAA